MSLGPSYSQPCIFIRRDPLPRRWVNKPREEAAVLGGLLLETMGRYGRGPQEGLAARASYARGGFVARIRSGFSGQAMSRHASRTLPRGALGFLSAQRVTYRPVVALR
jgi:hypothetical protein